MKVNLLSLIKDNIQIVITVLLMVIISGYVGMWSQKSTIEEWQNRYNAYRDSAAVVVEENKALLARVENMTEYVREVNDSIMKLNEGLDQRMEQLVALRSDLDSIRINITPEILEVTPPEVRDYVATLEQTVEVQDSTITELRAVDRLRVAQIDTLLIANSELVSQLDSVNVILNGLPDGPSDPDKIFGFIPKPSRTQSFIGGTLIGIVIMSVVK